MEVPWKRLVRTGMEIRRAGVALRLKVLRLKVLRMGMGPTSRMAMPLLERERLMGPEGLGCRRASPSLACRHSPKGCLGWEPPRRERAEVTPTPMAAAVGLGAGTLEQEGAAWKRFQRAIAEPRRVAWRI